MRLRLNTTLRAALIAAITAVGFTLTQAQATESGSLTLHVDAAPGWVLSSDSGSNSKQLYDYLNATFNDGGSMTFTMELTWDGGSCGYYQELLHVGRDETGFYLSANGGTHLLVGPAKDHSGSREVATSLTANQATQVTFTLTNKSEGTASASVTLGGQTYDVSADLTWASMNWDAADDQKWKYSIGCGGPGWVDKFPMDHFTITGNNITASYTAPPPEESLLWAGTSQSSEWNTNAENQNWKNGDQSVAFTAGQNVTFDGTAEYTTVVISTDVEPAKVAVSGQDYTFDVQADGYLEASSLTVTGNKLTIQGEGFAGVDKLELKEGGKLDIAANVMATTAVLATSDTAAAQVQDGGSLMLGTASKIDGAQFSDGGDGETSSGLYHKIYEGKAVASTGTGIVEWIGSINAFDNATTANHTYNLGYSNMQVTGNVKINANQRNVTWAVASGQTLEIGGYYWLSNKQYASVDGGVIIVGKNLKLAHESNNGDGNLMARFSATNGANVSLGGIEFAGGGNSVSIDSSTLTFTNAEGNVLSRTGANVSTANTVTLNDATLDATANSWTMTAMTGNNAATVSVTGATTLNVGEGQTLALTASSINASFTKTGAGAATISGGGALSDTTTVTAGTLSLVGDYAIDNIASGEVQVSYVDATGAPSTNGFQNASGTLNVYTGSGTLDMANGHFTYGGQDVTADVKDGVYTLAGEVSYTALYVNDGTEAIAAYKTAAQAKGQTLASVVMKDSTTLTVDDDYDGSISVASGKGIVNINSGKTVTGTKSNITLTGAGTYALDAGTESLGTGTTLGQDWTGIVCITSVNKNNIDLSQYVKGTASTVELKGFTGWTNNWDGTITQNIKLTNNGDNAAWSNGAFSSTGQPEATFAGTWSGTGTFKRTSGNNMHYKYTGDISAWEGKFLMDSGNTRLTFAGSASAVNAEIAKNGGTLNVVVDNDAVFSKSVTADSLTVNASKSATFNGTATFGSVTQNEGASITVGTEGALTIGGGSLSNAITNNGTLVFSGDITASGLTVNKGTTGLIDVNDKTDSGNGFETTSGDYITIVNNGTEATLTPAGHKVTQDSVEYTIQADGTAVAAGGTTEYMYYYQTNGEVATSDITAYADAHGEFCMYAYVSDTGVLNVDNAMAFIGADGGTVNFVEGADIMYLTVSDDTKVSGLTDYSIMQIAAGKTATMKDGVTSGNVVFSSEEGGVKVTNIGEAAITYSLDNENAKVTADTMTVNGTEEVVVSNSLVVGEITNNNAEGLTLNGNVADGVTLNAAAGDIVLAGQTGNTVSVVDLNIAPNKTVTLMDENREEGTVTVSGVLTGGEATLLANLTLVGGADSMLDVDGGADKALTLGSKLTIDTTDGLVNLDQDTIDALAGLSEGRWLDLIVAADQTTLSYGGSYEGVSYDTLFSAAGLTGPYTVYAHDNAFGLVRGSQVPEPTTGTLSLLALAALAARRRRK